jgi:pullulanase
MIDSLVTWAKEYKVDAFRFDLMGHHMVSQYAQRARRAGRADPRSKTA